MFATTVQDIKYALRMLIKNPGFACVVIFTLALGIGANAAIFSLTDKVLLQRLPVSNPDELVAVSGYDPKDGPDYSGSFSYPMYKDLRDKSDAFTGLIARGGAQMNVSYGDVNERVRGELVSGNFYEVLGVRPWLGRLFTQDDDRVPGAHPVVVLSYGFWERRFGKDMNIVGKTILVNEVQLTVLGVTPPGFYGINLSSNPDICVPMMMTPIYNALPSNRLTRRQNQWLTLMARLKPGVSMQQAQASLELTYRQIREFDAQQLPATVSAYDRQKFLNQKIAMLPGNQGFQNLQTEMRTSLWLLFGATCAILLILCANLANLMMARATVRAQEIAVRMALGSGRWRLLKQCLTEGLVLSLLGGGVAVVIALWIKAVIMKFVPPDVQRNLESSQGLRFYGFILLVAVVVGVVFSLAPAIQAARQAFVPGLRIESRTFTSGGKLFSVRSALILVQVALSVPLLFSAALLVRTLQNLRSVDTGFNRENVLLASVNPMLNGYTNERSKIFYDQLMERIRALPAVSSAALASDSPVSGGWDSTRVLIEGYQQSEGERAGGDITWISPDYFKSLGIQIAQGRDFNAADREGAPKVTLVNESFAKKYFGDANPIGKRIGTDDTLDTTIIGVVKDAKYITMRSEMRRHFYLPLSQEPRLSDLAMHIKTKGDPNLAIEQVRSVVKGLDGHLPIYNIKTLTAEIDESLVQERLVSWLTTSFGVLAALLTALGIYGVLTFSVARRTREIGIRVALGAQRRDVFKLIMVRGFILIALGVLVGLAVSIASSRLIEGLLYGVAPNSLSTLFAVSGGLIAVALLACYIPARRATKVNPLVALRYE
jgi:predicted permease